MIGSHDRAAPRRPQNKRMPATPRQYKAATEFTGTARAGSASKMTPRQLSADSRSLSTRHRPMIAVMAPRP